MKIPRTVVRGLYQLNNERWPDGNRFNAYLPVWTASTAMDYVPNPNYFWDTDGRKFNDCVHSKLVGSVPGMDWVFPAFETTSGTRYVPAYVTRMSYLDGYYLSGAAWTTGTHCVCVSQSIYQNGKNSRIEFNIHDMWVKNPTTTSHKEASISAQVYIYFDMDESGNLWPSENRSYTQYDYGWPFPIKDWVIHSIASVGVPLFISKWSRITFNADGALAWSKHLLSVVHDLGMRFNAYAEEYRVSHPSMYYSTVWTGTEDVTKVNYSQGHERFLFHEDEHVAGGVDWLLLAGYKDFSSYHWNVLVQEAYLSCLQNMPRLSDNSISNIIELVGFIKSIVIDRKIEIPKSLQSAWLAYRYQYNTTKMDVEDAIAFVHRHVELGTLSRRITSRGTSEHEYKGVTVHCRCQADLTPRELSTLDKIWSALYTYGLQPDFYVIWDMIPFSFIVDWFIPVGSLVSVLDAKRMYSGNYYDIENIIFSISYDADVYNDRYRQYTRWCQQSPPELNGLYFFEQGPVSSRVKGFRVLDAASLFIG